MRKDITIVAEQRTLRGKNEARRLRVSGFTPAVLYGTGGESVAAVGARADRVIARTRPIDGRVLLVGHGHFFRVLGARWLGLPPSDGRLFFLSTASLSVLGYEHSRDEPVVRLWNDDRHVTT